MLTLISRSFLKRQNTTLSLIKSKMATNIDSNKDNNRMINAKDSMKIATPSSSSKISGDENTTKLSQNDNTQKSSSSNLIKPQIYDFILVLDFEATCDDKRKLIPQV